MDTIEKFGYCRFFDGDDSPTIYPEGDRRRRLWRYERHWVETPDAELEDDLQAYRRLGLGGFSADDGVPEALKAALWSQYCHASVVASLESPSIKDIAEKFKKWYLSNYLGSPSVIR